MSVWEVQALLRAVPVAGDEDLGADFVALIDPIRYPADGLTAEQIAEIRRIKARVERERLPRGADPATHTKLGRGGLSDVEWTVQLLQLQHAAEMPELQVPSTVEGLTALGERRAARTPTRPRRCARRGRLATRARNAIFLVRGRPSDQLPRPGHWSWPGSRGPAATGRTRTPGSSSTTTAGPPGTRASVVEQVFYGQPADRLRTRRRRVWRVAGARATLVAARIVVTEGWHGGAVCGPSRRCRMSPTLARSVAAEFVGTALLVLVAVGAAVVGIDTIGPGRGRARVRPRPAGPRLRHRPDLGLPRQPGGHPRRPALARDDATEAAVYWVAQFAGGIAGAAVLQLLTSGFGDVTDQTGALGSNDYGATISLGGAFVLEALLTFVFVARDPAGHRARRPRRASPGWRSV